MYKKYEINLTTSTPSFQILTTRDIHLVSYDSTWHSTVHRHPFTELFYCLNGKGHVWTEEGEFPVQNGTLLLINAHINHTEFSSKEYPLSYIVIGIDGVSVASQHSELPRIYTYDDQYGQFKTYFMEILNEFKKQSEFSAEIIHNLVTLIMLKLHTETNSLTVQSEQQTEFSAPVYHAKFYIDHHFPGDISLEKLEHISHTSRYYLSTLFKQEVGQTISEYITNVRIERAKELLISTNYTITQIATMVGYNSASYFTTVFRKMNEQSPKDFRYKHQKISRQEKKQ